MIILRVLLLISHCWVALRSLRAKLRHNINTLMTNLWIVIQTSIAWLLPILLNDSLTLEGTWKFSHSYNVRTTTSLFNKVDLVFRYILTYSWMIHIVTLITRILLLQWWPKFLPLGSQLFLPYKIVNGRCSHRVVLVVVLIISNYFWQSYLCDFFSVNISLSSSALLLDVSQLLLNSCLPISI